MSLDEHTTDLESSAGCSAKELLEAMRSMLGAAEQPERCRVLGTLVSELLAQNGSDGPRPAESAGLGRKLQELEKRKADLEDMLQTCQADLTASEQRLDIEKTRGEQLKTVSANQRARLESIEADLARMEAELLNKNNELHQLANENEALQIKLQRAQVASSDTSRTDILEQGKHELAVQVQTLTAELEQLRKEKNEQIEQLTSQLRQAAGQSAQSADAMLTSLWQRLVAASPPLVTEGHLQPTPQAAERLVDSFIALAGFIYKFDQDMRVILDGSTRNHQEMTRLWKAYREQCDLYQMIRETVAPIKGKNVGALNMQLRVCRDWAFAEMVSSDSAIAWVGEELTTHLLGPAGAGSNPKCTVKEYVKADGPGLFLEHIRKLRGEKLAEVYGHGG